MSRTAKEKASSSKAASSKCRQELKDLFAGCEGALSDCVKKRVFSIPNERACGFTQENGSARFQRAASGILAGRRAKAADCIASEVVQFPGPHPSLSFRQDAGKDTLEACAPVFLPAALSFRESGGALIVNGKLFTQSLSMTAGSATEEAAA